MQYDEGDLDKRAVEFVSGDPVTTRALMESCQRIEDACRRHQYFELFFEYVKVCMLPMLDVLEYYGEHHEYYTAAKVVESAKMDMPEDRKCVSSC
jgi:hypothetical protein